MTAKAAPLSQVFDLDRIRKLCGVRMLADASLIRDGDIEDLDNRDGRLTATVRGTMPYRVTLCVEGSRKAAWSCTCPRGEDGRFCKHTGAVALTLHGGGRQALRPEPDRSAAVGTAGEHDPVFAFLVGLDQRELARLVVDAATRDTRTARAIEAKMAAAAGRPAVDAKAWRKAITAAFGRPSHYVDYHEASRWAERVNGVLGDLRGLLDDGEAAAVVPLVEYAFERADKATQHVDGSAGWFSDISRQIADLHLRACQAARPDPIALAGRLVELDLHAELDTFRRAATTYADVLGPDGLAAYRKLVEPAYHTIEPRPDHRRSAKELHLVEAMLGLAQAADDADEVIRIKSPYLHSPYDYAEIVAILHGVGRTDEAIGWAHRGLALPGRHFQTRELRNQLVGLLHDRGDTTGARDVRLEGFRTSPSLAGYKDLLAESPEGDRDRQRTEIHDWLRQRATDADGHADRNILVEILLYEGDIDAAWHAATTTGCDQRWWMTLARAREQDHPTDAIPIYQRAIDDLIDEKKRSSYQDAVTLMARVERLYTAAGGPGGWTAYLTDITTRHRQKTSFMTKVREHGWHQARSRV